MFDSRRERMFPLSTSNKSGKIPIFTLLIIIINIAVFIKTLSVQQNELLLQFALIPSSISFSNPQTLLPFVTSIFLHAGFFHIFINMWFLWIFGDNIEANIGKIKFIILFFLSGIAGNLMQYMLNPASSIPIIGASGAVSGILGAYYVIFPKVRIKTAMLLLFSFVVVNVPAVIYVFYWFVVQLFSGFASIATFQNGGVAFWAHIGGFLFGYWFAKRFRKSEQSYIEGEIVG